MGASLTTLGRKVKAAEGGVLGDWVARGWPGCTPISAYSVARSVGRSFGSVAQQEKYYRKHHPPLSPCPTPSGPVRRHTIGLPVPHSSPALLATCLLRCITPSRFPLPVRITSQSLKLRS